MIKHPGTLNPISQAEHEAARKKGLEAGFQEGKKMGAEQERARITGILMHKEAEGRFPQALALAKINEMQPEAAAEILKVLPKASPKSKASSSSDFAAAMKALGNPDVTADAEIDDDSTQSIVHRVLKA